MNKDQFAYLNMEIKALESNCIRLQQEINCLRMEPCQLEHCVKERDVLRAFNEQLINGIHATKTIMDLESRAARYREALEKIKALPPYGTRCSCSEDSSCGEDECKEIATAALSEETE